MLIIWMHIRSRRSSHKNLHKQQTCDSFNFFQTSFADGLSNILAENVSHLALDSYVLACVGGKSFEKCTKCCSLQTFKFHTTNRHKQVSTSKKEHKYYTGWWFSGLFWITIPPLHNMTLINLWTKFHWYNFLLMFSVECMGCLAYSTLYL